MILGYIIAKCLYATGRRPFALPHRRNYVPAGHLPPPNASLFFFSRGVAYSLPPSRFQRATSLREGGSYVPFREGVNIPGAC